MSLLLPGPATRPTAQPRTGYLGEVIPMHRAFRRLAANGRSLAFGAAMAPLFIIAYVVAYPWLIDFWQATAEFWIDRLQVPGNVLRVPLELWFGYSVDRIAIEIVPGAITLQLWLTHAAVTLIVFLLTFKFVNRALPLAYALRIICALHACSLFFFFFFENAFPYEVVDHTRDFFGFTLFLHVIVAPVLLLSYYVLESSWKRQLGATLVILGYFVVALPFQLVAHAALAWLGTPLVMPVLYLAFGPFMNVLAFVALYSWVVTWGAPATD